MKEYRVRKGLRLLVYILASLVILIYGSFSIALIIPPFNETIKQMQDSMPGLWLPVLFIAMIVLMIVSLMAVKRRKVIITNESVISINLLSKTELKLKEIKGFHLDVAPKYPQFQHLIIDALDNKKKSIRITPFLENMNGLRAELNLKLKNLDDQKIEDLKEKFQNEEQEILKNDEFGFSIEERKNKLKKARLIAGLLNGAGILIALWMFFFPNPYKYAIIACISLPLIAIIAIKLSKGLIRIDAEKGSAYPSAPAAIIVPAISLALRAMLDFSIDDYSNIWIPVILIAIVLTALLIIGNKELSFKNGKEYFTILSFFVFTFVYGYGAVVTTNCMFDKSEPEVFASQVLQKEINRGRKSTSYDLKLSPWGNKIDIQKISVDAELYDNLQVGYKVSVYRFKGKFDIPWIVVDYSR